MRQGSAAGITAAVSHPKLALLPLVAGGLAFLAVACSDRDRPGVGPVSNGGDIATLVIYGTVHLPGGLDPAPGGLVRALVTRGACDNGVVTRRSEAKTGANGEYRLEVIADLPPFEGCVWLDVDFNLDTLLPDTTVYRPGVRLGSALPPRDSIRLDVTLTAP